MELEMADLDFFTLKYKQAERERKVGDQNLRGVGDPGGPSALATRTHPFDAATVPRGRPRGTLRVPWKPQPPMAGLCVS